MSISGQDKKIIKASISNNLFLTIIDMVFDYDMEKREKSIDFHDEISNKIDNLIDKTESSKDYTKKNEELNENISLKESSIEIRSPLSKKINSIAIEPINHDLRNNPKIFVNENLNYNISPDINNNLEFISELNSINNKPQSKDSMTERIEIIDFDNLAQGEVKNKTKTTIVSLERQKENKQKIFNISGIFNKKASTGDDKSKDGGLFDLAKNKQSKSKPQLYFLSKPNHQKRDSSDLSKNSESSNNKNIENELKELKKKELELVEKKKKIIEEEKRAEKIQKEKEREELIEAKKRESKELEEKKRNRERLHQEEKLKKLELKKAELEKRERERLARKSAKKKEFELKKKAREEKLLKKLEEKKVIKLEKEKEKAVKRASLEQQRLQKLRNNVKVSDEDSIKTIKEPTIVKKD